MNTKHSDVVGKVFSTNGGTNCRVIEKLCKRKVRVKFLDSFGYKVETGFHDLLKGYVKNPFAPAVCGVGYLGVGYYSPSKGGVKTLAYVQWHGFIRRSYDLPYKNTQASYEKVNVCKEWHCFNTYADWFYNQKGWDKGFHLDKDILGNSSYKYSPETCCLVPVAINAMVASGSSRKGGYAVGVFYSKKDKKFSSSICVNGEVNYLGYFDTELEAFSVYKKEKDKQARNIADFWKEGVDERVYDALYNLEMTKDGWLTKGESAFKFYEDNSVEIPKYYMDNYHLVSTGVEYD